MIKVKYSLLIAAISLLASCTKYVDSVVPKGRSLLSSIADLDLVMNYNWSGGAFNFEDLSVLTNDSYPFAVNLPSAIALPPGQQNPLLTYYVPEVRNIPLADTKYELHYSYIGTTNTVINGVDGASGDRIKATQLKAEAKIMRAFFHYRMVNIYAKAYNPATAETDGGIAYVTDNDVTQADKKLSVAEVYRLIIKDINDAMADIPAVRLSTMRPGKAFAHAFKAQVLLTLRDYAGALAEANASLALNNTFEDQTIYSRTGVAVRTNTAEGNLIYMYSVAARPSSMVASIEALSYYENGNFIRDSTLTYKQTTAYGNITNSPSGNGTLYLWSSNTYFQNSAGVTTEDVALVKAECLARTSKYAEAMDVINSIRIKRIKPYAPLTANTEAAAMNYIMRTARIEYLFTYKNFMNIKRWNTFEEYKQTITRTINGKTFTLAPDSPLWIFAFPISTTLYNANITQNF